jgi:hypothetical protein
MIENEERWDNDIDIRPCRFCIVLPIRQIMIRTRYTRIALLAYFLRHLLGQAKILATDFPVAQSIIAFGATHRHSGPQ